ncbi:MAG TPA: flagellin, partial [Actinomycetales bacterium]
KLSSGYRINRAADDAAGLSISEGLRSQIGGLKMAVRNAQDGVNVVQTADGALNETTAILQRMRDLAVQAANGGSQDINAQGAAQTEFGQLSSELDRIANTTAFSGQKLLDTNYNGDFQVGANAGTNDRIAVKLDATVFGPAVTAVAGSTGAATSGKITGATNAATIATGGNLVLNVNSTAVTTALTTGDTAAQSVTKINAAFTAASVNATAAIDGTGKLTVTSGTTGTASTVTVTSGTGTVLANLGLTAAQTNSGVAATTPVEKVYGSPTGFTASGLGLGSAKLDGTTIALGVAAARDALGAIDNALKGVSTARATMGAFQNRFEHTINNLNVAVENLSASESQIRDTDMAKEMTMFTRSQILQQAGTSMLAQANQSQQGVLKLLG